MNNLRLLLKVQLLGYVNLSYLLHSRDKRKKRRLALYTLGGLALLLMCVVYSALIAYGCVQIGLGEILPGLLVFLTALVTLMFTFLKSGGVLFGFRDYDLVMSLPVKTGAVVCSRALSLYLGSLLFVLAAGLPVCVIYGIFSGLSAAAWCMLLLALLFMPLLPMAVSMLLTALIQALAARSRHRNLIVILSSILLVFAIFAGSLGLQNISVGELTAFGAQFHLMLSRVYPPAAWLSASLASGEPGGFLLFAAVNAGCMAVFLRALAHFYKKLNTVLASHRRSRSRWQHSARIRTPFMALYQKELRQLFTCPIYLMNSSISAFLMAALSLFLAFFGPERLNGLINIPMEAGALAGMLPWVFLFFIGMSSTTASSVSLEGKSLWIAKSVPVEPALLYRAKLAVNLTVLLPAVLISAAAACRILPLTPYTLFTLLAVPACYALLTAVFGLFLNLKKPWYDWNYEYQPVKQSFPTFVSIFSGMLFSVLMMGISYLTLLKAQTAPAAPLLWSVLFCVLCLSASLLLWKNIRKTQLPFS